MSLCDRNVCWARSRDVPSPPPARQFLDCEHGETASRGQNASGEEVEKHDSGTSQEGQIAADVCNRYGSGIDDGPTAAWRRCPIRPMVKSRAHGASLTRQAAKVFHRAAEHHLCRISGVIPPAAYSACAVCRPREQPGGTYGIAGGGADFTERLRNRNLLRMLSHREVPECPACIPATKGAWIQPYPRAGLTNQFSYRLVGEGVSSGMTVRRAAVAGNTAAITWAACGKSARGGGEYLLSSL